MASSERRSAVVESFLLAAVRWRFADERPGMKKEPLEMRSRVAGVDDDWRSLTVILSCRCQLCASEEGSLVLPFQLYRNKNSKVSHHAVL